MLGIRGRGKLDEIVGTAVGGEMKKTILLHGK